MRLIRNCFVGGAAVALGAFVAVLIVSGGWQAAVAAVGILGGLVSVLSFIVLGVASERPQPPRRRAPARASTSRARTTAETKTAPAGRPQSIAPPKPISLPSASR
jgi:hypothetical protein